MARLVIFTNLLLLILFPAAWAAPLLRAGVLPIFGLTEISVVSGLRSLWTVDPVLALVVAILALIVPYAKTIALALVHFGRLPPRLLPVLGWLGKLAMAEIFLIALYIVVVKGVGLGRVETAWGLYLLTGCILASLVVSGLSKGLPQPAKLSKR
jgi:paraquat-inducible protein A